MQYWYYIALGLEPKLALDLEDLKKRFYELSRQWHPDHFSRATPEERHDALDRTALLNDAFRTLRDPVARAEYYLEQSHVPLPKEAPLELLQEVFDLNIAMEELRAGDESARSQLEAERRRFHDMQSDIDAQMNQMFAQYDATKSGDVLEGIRVTLHRRRYISNLLRDVDKELNVPIG